MMPRWWWRRGGGFGGGEEGGEEQKPGGLSRAAWTARAARHFVDALHARDVFADVMCGRSTQDAAGATKERMRCDWVIRTTTTNCEEAELLCIECEQRRPPKR